MQNRYDFNLSVVPQEVSFNFRKSIQNVLLVWNPELSIFTLWTDIKILMVEAARQ
jgi:hypothetical protein